MNPENIIHKTINLPGKGESVIYKVDETTAFNFGFNYSDATFTGNGGDLVISSEDNGVIILEGYLPLAKEELVPAFVLEDGEEIPGNVYLFAFSQDSNEIETAANTGTSGSGAGEYADMQGQLFDSQESLQGQEETPRDEMDFARRDTPEDSFDTADAAFNANREAEESEGVGTGGTDEGQAGAVNHAPTSDPVAVSTNEDTDIIITKEMLLANADDVDTDNALLTVQNLAPVGADGTITENADGTWTFSPNENFNGEVKFNFEINDGAAENNITQVTGTVTVDAVNDAPTSAPVAVSTNEDTDIIITKEMLLANA
ncbi:hypothetical protein SAMN05660337_2548, partial [Maridesulfovibrio ferrireducens]